jgi:GNAT superfamily N-acetyltransferase
MDDALLRALAYDGLYPFFEVLAAGAPTSRMQRLGGVTATVVPATPDRSFMNSVAYDDTEALQAALDHLSVAYDEAGVNAWTVWVRPGDVEAARSLEAAGHMLDAQPTAMGMPLREWEPREGSGAGIRPIGLADVTRINDVAYGWHDEFVNGLLSAPPELRLHGALLEGEPVACSAWIRRGDDCAVYLVACLPAARGRGLATALMSRMLSEAHAEGCATTSLQASSAGYPIYRRLGYRDLGRLEMWERRRPAA